MKFSFNYIFVKDTNLVLWI